MQTRQTYLELAKIAKERGTLNNTLLRVYLLNMVRQHRKEEHKKAATAMAARENLLNNF